MGLDLRLKTFAHNLQELVSGATLLSVLWRRSTDNAASFVFLISYFLALARSLNRTSIMFLTNQSAALELSGMVALPCTWTVRVEW